MVRLPPGAPGYNKLAKMLTTSIETTCSSAGRNNRNQKTANFSCILTFPVHNNDILEGLNTQNATFQHQVSQDWSQTEGHLQIFSFWKPNRPKSEHEAKVVWSLDSSLPPLLELFSIPISSEIQTWRNLGFRLNRSRWFEQGGLSRRQRRCVSHCTGASVGGLLHRQVEASIQVPKLISNRFRENSLLTTLPLKHGFQTQLPSRKFQKAAVI